MFLLGDIEQRVAFVSIGCDGFIQLGVNWNHPGKEVNEDLCRSGWPGGVSGQELGVRA